MRLSVLAAGVLLTGATVALAQAPPPPMPPMPPMSPGMGPHIVLAPPPGTMLPPLPPMPPPASPEMFENARRQVVDMFIMLMDVNHDGLLSRDEVHPWVVGVGMPPMAEMPPPGEMPPPPPGGMPPAGMMPPPPGEMPPPPPGGMPPAGMMPPPPGKMPAPGMLPPPPPGMAPPAGMMPPPPPGGIVPPDCSAELVTGEQLPQAENVPCGSTSGNLLFRTVCNMPGFDSQAISLPDGRDADCFGIESQTAGVVIFTIYPESDPANLIFDSTRDGLHNIGAVHLGDTGVYRIDLDEVASDPGAKVTVRFIDHPE